MILNDSTRLNTSLHRCVLEIDNNQNVQHGETKHFVYFMDIFTTDVLILAEH